MKKYNIGDKVVITGKARGVLRTHHCFAFGSCCKVKGFCDDPGFYMIEGVSKNYGHLTDQIIHYTDFQPAPQDRIPASDGHEGETAYQFISTDQQSI